MMDLNRVNCGSKNTEEKENRIKEMVHSALKGQVGKAIVLVIDQKTKTAAFYAKNLCRGCAIDMVADVLAKSVGELPKECPEPEEEEEIDKTDF